MREQSNEVRGLKGAGAGSLPAVGSAQAVKVADHLHSSRLLAVRNHSCNGMSSYSPATEGAVTTNTNPNPRKNPTYLR